MTDEAEEASFADESAPPSIGVLAAAETAAVLRSSATFKSPCIFPISSVSTSSANVFCT
jgi:hypothetical protein